MLGLLVAAVLQTGCADPSHATLHPPAPPDTAPSLDAYDPLRGFDPATPLGIGHLRPVRDEIRWPWWHHIRLPLFALPGGPLQGWIVDGWWLPAGAAARPFSLNGLVETGYEDPSFIVLARRDDGWLQLRRVPGEDGLAWTHACLLAIGDATLGVEPWEARFTGEGWGPLFFRAEVPRRVLEHPDDTARVVHTIGADRNGHAIEALEVAGEWMRIRVTEPSNYCVEVDSARLRVTEGWIRWRDAAGPRLWYNTRGC